MLQFLAAISVERGEHDKIRQTTQHQVLITQCLTRIAGLSVEYFQYYLYL